MRIDVKITTYGALLLVVVPFFLISCANRKGPKDTKQLIGQVSKVSALLVHDDTSSSTFLLGNRRFSLLRASIVGGEQMANSEDSVFSYTKLVGQLDMEIKNEGNVVVDTTITDMQRMFRYDVPHSRYVAVCISIFDDGDLIYHDSIPISSFN